MSNMIGMHHIESLPYEGITSEDLARFVRELRSPRAGPFRRRRRRRRLRH